MTSRVNRKGGSGEGSPPPSISGALLAHVVDELDHVHGVFIILVGHRDEFLVFAVGQPVESSLVLGRASMNALTMLAFRSAGRSER